MIIIRHKKRRRSAGRMLGLLNDGLSQKFETSFDQPTNDHRLPTSSAMSECNATFGIIPLISKAIKKRASNFVMISSSHSHHRPVPWLLTYAT
jgi:hypothetical protein